MADNNGLIIGIFFGCVAAACLLLVLLGCCLKKTGFVGRGVTFHNNPNVAVVCSGTTTSQYAGYNPNIGQPAAVLQPPPYGPPAQGAPPPYSYINTAAYPPGTGAPDHFVQVPYKTK